MSVLPLSIWDQVISNHLIFIAACIGFIILLLPKGIPGRLLGLVWLLPLFTYAEATPKKGEIAMTMLDVGQGLAIVLQTEHHVLLYDTGPRYLHYDSGESVIIPFLKIKKINSIDVMMISHGDNDHIGGMDAIYQTFKIKKMLSSVPQKIKYAKADYCLAGDSWQWDGVTFTIVYPAPANLNLGNDSSCALLIDNGHKRLLLTGDIEKKAELNLLRLGHHINADVITSPHHGSKTSNTRAFLRQVRPEIVLYSVGYRNRYHFPHPSVVNRYTAMNVKQWATDQSGAIEIKIDHHHPIQVQRYREHHKRYWYYQ